MTRPLQELEKEISELNETERDVLIKVLISKLDESFDEDVERAWLKEAQQRYKELKDGSVSPIPVEEVTAKARKLLQK
jgi:putative addiction module component (TIGR02574 family)